MTFLLFLAYIAALEYILRKQPSKGKPGSPTGVVDVIDSAPLCTRTVTSDLLALGQALTTHKPGQPADSEIVAEKTKTGSGPF